MSDQATLFGQVQDWRRGMIHAVRDAGVEAATRSEDPEWLQRASEVIERFASSGEHFSADDIRAIVGDPVRAASMGGAFRSAVSRGLIAPAGLGTSSRIERHGGLMRLWVGVRVRQGQEA